MERNKVVVFWFRRDLRLEDNAGLYHALRSGFPVVPFFLYDKEILDKLEDHKDPRLTFIFNSLESLKIKLSEYNSSLKIINADPLTGWKSLLQEFDIQAVYFNEDYEPYARKRDAGITALLEMQDVKVYSFKDQVIFSKAEIVKDDGKPYTVFSPYKRKWLGKLNEFYLKSYPSNRYLKQLYPSTFHFPSLTEIGFEKSTLALPPASFQHVIADYAKTRDIPSIAGTSRISVHLRFGTVSIRELARAASAVHEQTWLNELIWREFYMMILWHFPHTIDHSFKPDYDRIRWRNNEQEFQAWCEGQTGYPLVDAGMRELKATGFMHNRVRMVTASFLCKHLLIDWRWGEAYFAKKLLDYEQASNVGSWQWAASSGNDAV